MPKIKKVTYSKPVTVIRWDDNTITKSFCDEVDSYDELTGFLMCIIKKMMPAKEMRKLFSEYVYGDNPKYIKRITPKKEKETFYFNMDIASPTQSPTHMNINSKDVKPNTLKFDTTTYDVEDFIKLLNELMEIV